MQAQAMHGRAGFPGSTIGQVLEHFTHEALESPGKGFQNRMDRWFVRSEQRGEVDGLRGISLQFIVKVYWAITMCAKHCANVIIMAIPEGEDYYFSISWVEKLRPSEVKLLAYCHRACEW